jgi:hypothetical protein
MKAPPIQIVGCGEMVTDEYLERHRQQWSAREAEIAASVQMSNFTFREPEPEPFSKPPPFQRTEDQERDYRKAAALNQLETELAKYEAEKAADTAAALRSTALGRLAVGVDPATALRGTVIGRRLFGGVAR